MVKVSITKQHKIKLRVSVTQDHIDQGVCGLDNKCGVLMGVVAAAVEQLGLKTEAARKLHAKVDCGHVRLNFDGYRWRGDTPSFPRNWLLRFDRAKQLRGEKRAEYMQQHCRPHSFVVVLTRQERVSKMTPARQEQINDARRKRVAAGMPDRTYGGLALHKRVLGYAADRASPRPRANRPKTGSAKT